ncbi:hypothetical protein TSAR_005910 [Trichomalopsis sarcophagae]|uniref:Uncharacterized protein n=1 Tax=Trichomalopsis sarcophagae TaxID=543379 RepID=A0A232EPL0_9HYME|nr:hypothetical protein TSAR_005910 [Trichomalopsis sarcophagae]
MIFKQGKDQIEKAYISVVDPVSTLVKSILKFNTKTGMLMRSTVYLSEPMDHWEKVIGNFVKKHVQVFPMALLSKKHHQRYKWYEIRGPTAKEKEETQTLDSEYIKCINLEQFQPKYNETFYSPVYVYVNHHAGPKPGKKQRRVVTVFLEKIAKPLGIAAKKLETTAYGKPTGHHGKTTGNHGAMPVTTAKHLETTEYCLSPRQNSAYHGKTTEHHGNTEEGRYALCYNGKTSGNHGITLVTTTKRLGITA